MSYGRELMDEMEVEASVYWFELLRDLRSRTWTMKDGKWIFVEDMTDSHLKNTIRLLEKRTRNGDELAKMWLPVMERELHRRS